MNGRERYNVEIDSFGLNIWWNLSILRVASMGMWIVRQNVCRLVRIMFMTD